jgi:uncharacterized protein YceK
MRFIRIAFAATTLSLTSCASVIGTTHPPDDRSLMFIGTQLNIGFISKESCKPAQYRDLACAYDKVLAPFSVIDFVPSLVLDIILLPYTAIYTALHHKQTPTAPDEPAEVHER